MVYDSAEIETRWQARWRDARVFDAEVDDSREKFYCLEMRKRLKRLIQEWSLFADYKSMSGISRQQRI